MARKRYTTGQIIGLLRNDADHAILHTGPRHPHPVRSALTCVEQQRKSKAQMLCQSRQ